MTRKRKENSARTGTRTLDPQIKKSAALPTELSGHSFIKGQKLRSDSNRSKGTINLQSYRGLIKPPVALSSGDLLEDNSIYLLRGQLSFRVAMFHSNYADTLKQSAASSILFIACVWQSLETDRNFGYFVFFITHSAQQVFVLTGPRSCWFSLLKFCSGFEGQLNKIRHKSFYSMKIQSM